MIGHGIGWLFRWMLRADLVLEELEAGLNALLEIWAGWDR